MSTWTRLLVAGGGAAATVVVAWLMDLPASDTLALLGLAGGGALAAGAAGLVVMRAMRSASIRAQAVAVALVAVFGTAVGIVLAAGAMFVSSHDLGALLVVLTASTTVAVLLAAGFGGRIGTASRDLEDLVRRVGDGDVLMVGDVPIAVELQRLAAELAASSERLDESRRRERSMESARRELIAWVSHDLRTPLAGIRAMVEALEDGVVDDPADVARYHANIRAETDRLAMLVDDLFELSRIEAGAVELRLEDVRLGDVVEEAVAASSATAAAKGVRIARRGWSDGASAGRDVDPVVRVAPVELLRVVRNLLDNAIRHTPPDSAIEVRCSVDPAAGTARLSVLDACGGIPETDIGRVFDLAFRGDRARTPEDDRRGGLGLAIARGLVHAHDGSISVRNAGDGCCFTVELPTAA